MAICIVCGKVEDSGLKDSMRNGWVFTKCPECQRGFPFDIIAMYLSKSTPEEYMQGFCQEHWFKDSGICSYCKIKRQGSVDSTPQEQNQPMQQLQQKQQLQQQLQQLLQQLQQ